MSFGSVYPFVSFKKAEEGQKPKMKLLEQTGSPVLTRKLESPMKEKATFDVFLRRQIGIKSKPHHRRNLVIGLRKLH